MSVRRWIGPLVMIALLAGALTGAPGAHAQEMMSHELTLEAAALPVLGDGYAYEGWLIVDGAPVSTGVFQVDGEGMAERTTFDVDVAPDEASAFVLTIEPSPDPDPAPSAVHLLGGDIVDGSASLTVGHAAALGSDFASAAGSYILAAPSGGMDAAYANGIWWLDPMGPSASLTLPSLPDGWVYEGWVVGEEGPVSTGRFTSVSGADSDGAGPDAGMEGAPPFPGQDFVEPARDLIGGTAVISIEPEPDDSPAPFALKPLVDGTIEDVGAETAQAMANNAATFPTATVTFDAGAMMQAESPMADSSTAESPAVESAPPQVMPETGDTPSPLLPLAAVGMGLLLLSGAVVARRALR